MLRKPGISYSSDGPLGLYKDFTLLHFYPLTHFWNQFSFPLEGQKSQNSSVFRLFTSLYTVLWLFWTSWMFFLRYTGAYEGYPAPRDGYGARRYDVLLLSRYLLAIFFLLIDKINKNENCAFFFEIILDVNFFWLLHKLQFGKKLLYNVRRICDHLCRFSIGFFSFIGIKHLECPSRWRTE